MPLLEDRKIELVCSDCGYGVVAVTAPDTCPMCHGSSWDMPAWRPFSGLAAFQGRPEPDEPALRL
jgi:hypothetical protein